MPFTSAGAFGSVQAFCAGVAAGSRTAPTPRSVIPSVVIATFSWCRPVTTIVSPGRAASTAAWIESPGPTTTLLAACAEPIPAASAPSSTASTTTGRSDRAMSIPPKSERIRPVELGAGHQLRQSFVPAGCRSCEDRMETGPRAGGLPGTSGEARPRIGHVRGYLLDFVEDGTHVTSYCHWPDDPGPGTGPGSSGHIRRGAAGHPGDPCPDGMEHRSTGPGLTRPQRQGGGRPRPG
jgi:hypothetical protein